MAIITFEPSGKKVDVEDGTSILQAAIEADETSVTCCGIIPACGQCSLDVIEGEENLTPPDAREEQHRKDHHFLPFRRLGCMALPVGDVRVKLDR